MARKPFENITFLKMEEALMHPFCTTKEMRLLSGNSSQKTVKKIEEKALDKINEYKKIAKEMPDSTEKFKILAKCYFEENTRPKRYPTQIVIEVLNINEDYIRDQAKKMREVQNEIKN